MNKFFTSFGVLSVSIAVGVIAYTELSEQKEKPLASYKTQASTTIKLQNTKESLNQVKQTQEAITDQRSKSETVEKKQQKKTEHIVFDYDISTPASNMTVTELRSEIEDLEKIVADSNLINRLNNGLAIEEERTQAGELFKRLTSLRSAELKILVKDFEKKMAKYEQEHKERLERYKNSPLGEYEEI
ncbi:hypothetical protein H0A36_24790 [Endozoicomonas sp. SM1973]|uniref:Uncharacterized protein n=1 Tax=Spartinivicinus marinus TaxID=2994442 RepID=A0A853I5R0_9GAMM|nr:hypothetical protein [Spartinivicinus marinus]MCX4024940.1 hypothetical protein [Spartinivicinus marinus]NYZ69240.1 hypothetical protein [Spartinivicinus marinus]